MPQIIETTVYHLEELSDDSKEQARAWYRGIAFDDDWHEPVYEDFERICEILGLRLKTSTVRLFGGGTRQKPRIWFSGFSSQGDGACFEAFYSYKNDALNNIRAHAPQDTELHQIAAALLAIQRRNFFQLHAETVHRGHHYHELCMAVSVERDSPTYRDMTANAEDIVTEALRDLARWLYRQLEREYEYQTSNEAVDEAIQANEYSFTEPGRRFG